MASGKNAQMTVKTEATYGTAIAATEGVEFVQETMKGEEERIESKGLRPGRTALRTDQWVPGRGGASGSATFELRSEGFGTLLRHMLGLPVNTVVGSFTPTVNSSAFSPVSLDAQSFTLQVGRPPLTGALIPYTYDGCKITGYEISCKVNELLELKLDIDARKETAGDQGGATTLQTAVYPTTGLPYTFAQCAVLINGAAVPIRSFSIKAGTALDTDRWMLGSRYKVAQVEGDGLPDAMIEMEGDFSDGAKYARMASGALVPVLITFTGDLIAGAGSERKLILSLANCRTDGDTTNVDGPQLLEEKIRMKALEVTGTPHIQITYVSKVDYSA